MRRKASSASWCSGPASRSATSGRCTSCTGLTIVISTISTLPGSTSPSWPGAMRRVPRRSCVRTAERRAGAIRTGHERRANHPCCNAAQTRVVDPGQWPHLIVQCSIEEPPMAKPTIATFPTPGFKLPTFDLDALFATLVAKELPKPEAVLGNVKAGVEKTVAVAKEVVDL